MLTQLIQNIYKPKMSKPQNTNSHNRDCVYLESGPYEIFEGYWEYELSCGHTVIGDEPTNFCPECGKAILVEHEVSE